MINYIKKHKYIFTFVLITILFIPYFYYYYPGIVINDTKSQLKQALGLKPLSNHHPVFQTFLWWIFIKIGSIFNNNDIAIVINSLFQIIMMSLVFTYSIYQLDNSKIKNKFLVFIYALYPVFGIFSINTTKDTMFSISILFFIIELTKIIEKPNELLTNKKNIFLLIISSILVILFKNQGIFIILSSLIFCVIYLKKYLKQFLSVIGIIIFLFVFWNNVIFNILNVKQTENVESLAVPLSQINHIVYNNYDELDEAMINRISKFISIDLLREIYDELTIDLIKKSFNENYYSNHKLEFFEICFDLLKEYPSESFNSFWLKIKRFILPTGSIEFVNDTIKDVLSLYKIAKPVELLSINNYACNYFAICYFIDFFIILLFHPAVNLYLLIFISIYCLIKNKKEILLLVPIFVGWISAFLSPTLVIRYILPSLVCLPYLIYYIFDVEKNFDNLYLKLFKNSKK